jgi:ribosomal protein S18 acetylase RimI-like enzyme
MTELMTATAANADAVALALADAFTDDPLMRWLAPPRDYPRRSRHVYRLMLDHAVPHGAVDVVDAGGGTPLAAAIWLPPGHWRVPPLALARGLGKVIRAGGYRVPRMLGRLTAVEKEHPPGPDHWYLEAIGVVLSHQGQGLGSRLLAKRTAQFDAQGMPAYLECSNERNIALYERHGFRVTKSLTFRNGPPQWLMWRDPR